MKANLFFILSLIALTSICDTISQIFLKSTINSLSFNFSWHLTRFVRFIRNIMLTPLVWVGLFFSTTSLCIWLFVLSKADLNFAFSADSMHYIFIALASKFILKEKVSWQRWLGILSIIIGIVFVSLS
ncbi:MAG: EamA family transporter [Candidatus Omnitrophica bacterium]|nr:EamA family transporter [Candidatus Omnitrophota bacterium]